MNLLGRLFCCGTTTGDIESRKTSSILPETFDEKYIIGNKLLGKGAFSVVKDGRFRMSQEKVAIKIILARDMKDRKALDLEVKMLSTLDHPNILRQLDFYEEKTRFLIVMEYVAGGDLFDRVVKKTHYSERDARDLILIMFYAVKYLHDRNIVHRDLKPENILMKTLDNDTDIKLADFGFATFCTEPCLHEKLGTPNYVAPEILAGKAYGKAVDVWALGVILFILLSGGYPFSDANTHNLFKKISKAEYSFDRKKEWEEVSDEAKDLVRNMLIVKVSERFTLDQCLQHPWVVRAGHELALRKLGSSHKRQVLPCTSQVPCRGADGAQSHTDGWRASG